MCEEKFKSKYLDRIDKSDLKSFGIENYKLRIDIYKIITNLCQTNPIPREKLQNDDDNDNDCEGQLMTGKSGINHSNDDMKENVDIDSKMENIEEGKYNLLASSMIVNAGHPDSLDSDGTIADIGAFPYLNTFSGPTWYVKTDGSDLTGKGSSEEPFRSIQSAINFSDNGDSVSVLAGTFYEHINTKRKNIDIVGQGPGVSIIDGSNSGRVWSKYNVDKYHVRNR